MKPSDSTIKWMPRGPLIFALILLLSEACQASTLLGLIIGNNQGLSHEPMLRYATRDARQVHEVLTRLGGMNAKHSQLLLDARPSQVLRAFARLHATADSIRKQGGRVETLIFFSGHGGPEALHLAGERLPLAKVRHAFRELPSQLKFLITDACYSGALLANKGASLAPFIPVRLAQESQVDGSVILTSSGAGELAQESQELQGSLFTHYFVTGLQGAADFDRDSRVTVWESFEYIRRSLARRSLISETGLQTPGFDVDMRGSDHAVLTRLDRGKAKLHLNALQPGIYQVLDGRNRTLIARVEPKSGESLTLSLPKGEYVIRRTEPKRVYLAEADLIANPDKRLGKSDFQGYSLSSGVAKGGWSGLETIRASLSSRAAWGLPGLAAPTWYAMAEGAWRQGRWTLRPGAGYMLPSPARLDRSGVENTGLETHVGASYRWLRIYPWSLQIGPEAQLHFIHQKLTDGTAAWANPWTFSFLVSAQREIFSGFRIEGLLAPGTHGFRRLDGDIEHRPGFSAGLAVGKGF